MGLPPRAADCHPERRHAAHGLCSSCYYAKHPTGVAASKRARANYKQRHPVRLARSTRASRVKRYGLTPDEYRDMVVGQAGRCLICLRVPEHDLAIDHDHATHRVRGLLCKSCNLALGHLYDDARRADRAGNYLRATR